MIDTPGILDHSLEERNIIEMQAITALAHLRACILYVMDASESCGHSIEQQVKLFKEIKPLFGEKPILLVVNKVDVRRVVDLPQEQRELLESLKNDEKIQMMEMSTVTEQGVIEVRDEACQMLLAHRIETKSNNKEGFSHHESSPCCSSQQKR